MLLLNGNNYDNNFYEDNKMKVEDLTPVTGIRGVIEAITDNIPLYTVSNGRVYIFDHLDVLNDKMIDIINLSANKKIYVKK